MLPDIIKAYISLFLSHSLSHFSHSLSFSLSFSHFLSLSLSLKQTRKAYSFKALLFCIDTDLEPLNSATENSMMKPAYLLKSQVFTARQGSLCPQFVTI